MPPASLRRAAGASALGALLALAASALPVATAAAQRAADNSADKPAAKPAARRAASGAAAPAAKRGARAARAAARPRAAAAATPAAPDTLWPAKNLPPVLPGSILPARRIVAYYGNPLSKRMGVLGEYPVDQMLAKLDREVAAWNAADPAHPVQPALHLIATVAQGAPGKDGMYRYRVHPELIEKVYGWARRRNALLFLDVQIGKSTLEEELKPLVPYLQRPDVHLGLDPEFAMTKGGQPGKRVGSYDASHINYASSLLANLVSQHKLPPKVLVVHRFTGPMVTNIMQVRRDPRVQVVVHMDGWGPPYGKRATWSRFIYPYPLQYTGFKLFYHNDTKAGHPLMTPRDVLGLHPDPLYIQYQ
jgi:hypothetical protein